MKRLISLVVLLPLLLASMAAQKAPDNGLRNQLKDVAGELRTELAAHGVRVLGEEAYMWKTRVQDLDGCRLHLTVMIMDKMDGSKVTTESVEFSLGALQARNMEQRHSWLVLPCQGNERCVISSTSCQARNRDGAYVDCSTPSSRREESFLLQFDGDPAAANRILSILRRGVRACNTPASVSF